MNLLKSMIVALTGMTISLVTFANPPHKPDLIENGNVWVVSAYTDQSAAHTVSPPNRFICFRDLGPVGTHENYLWFDLDYPFRSGRARQEGDQVFMIGIGSNWCDPNQSCPPFRPAPSWRWWHDSMQWEIATESVPWEPTEGTGHWQLWPTNNNFVFPPRVYEGLWTNVKFRRIPLSTPYLCPQTSAEAQKNALSSSNVKTLMEYALSE